MQQGAWVQVVALSGVMVLALASVQAEPPPGSQPTDPCPGPPIAIAPALPANLPTSTLPAGTDPDVFAKERELLVNCFAWQSFIALNWPAYSDPTRRGEPATGEDDGATATVVDPVPPAEDPAGAPGEDNRTVTFGRPGNHAPVIWQTYKPVEDIFQADAAPPLEWSAPDEVEDSCASMAIPQALTGMLPTQRPVQLRSASKIRATFSDVTQAFALPLIDQGGKYVRYEQRLNYPAFQYIYDHKLYGAFASSERIVLPDGTIQIKAAWRELPQDATDRFKTTVAVLIDPFTGECTGPVTLGLVGLHIVRKVDAMWQMMWSTFEHVDNAPFTDDHPDFSRSYSFYDPTCDPSSACPWNASPPPLLTPQPGTPQPEGLPALDKVQVGRKHAIPSWISGLNDYVRWRIVQDRPGSVWQYYRLVNVSWPGSPRKEWLTPVPTPGPIDLSPYGFRSTELKPVSNVTMETYVQHQDCMVCHHGAAIALTGANGPNPPFASDFSFVFRNAKFRPPTPAPDDSP
jgi:hypothetical protein